MRHITRWDEHEPLWKRAFESWVASHVWTFLPHIWIIHIAHTSISLVTREWVTSHMWAEHKQQLKQALGVWVMSHMWISHVAHVYESCHTWMRHVAHMRWARSTVEKDTGDMSHVTHVNQSCHTCEPITSHIGISHVTRESVIWRIEHEQRLKMGTIGLSHVTHVNLSCHTCVSFEVCPMSHTYSGPAHMRIGHVTRVKWSRHTCEWVMSHQCMIHVTRVSIIWRIRATVECGQRRCAMSHM